MIDIEKGKTLIVRLMAVGPVIEGRAQRDVWFEVNGEVWVRLHYDMDRLFISRRSGLSPLRTRTQPSRPYLVRRQRLILDPWVLPCPVLLWRFA